MMIMDDARIDVNSFLLVAVVVELGAMSQEDVASALKRYQKHADMLRSPLEHLLQHLSQVAQNPQELRIDW